MSLFPPPRTYADSIGECWIDFSGITAVWVCARCGLQGGAWFSANDARSDAVKHKKAEHSKAAGRPINWDTYAPQPKRKPEGVARGREPKHGTSHEYTKYGCRCNPCRLAKRELYLRTSNRKRINTALSRLAEE